MKHVFAIFKKDARRFWPLLLLWGIALMVGIGVSTGAISIPPDSFGNSQLPVAYRFVKGIGALLFGLLIVAFIHEDALVGDRQFWMARPVRAGALAAAKLLSLGVWLLLPSAGAYALGALWLHANLGQILSGEVTWLVYLGSYGAVLLALAALTATVLQFATALGVLCLIVFSFGLSRSYYWYSDLSYQIGNKYTGASSQITLLAAICLLGCAVMLFQGIRRRRGQTILLLAVGFVVTPLSPFLSLTPKLGQKPREITPAAQIDFQSVGTRVLTDTKNGITHTYVVASYQLTGEAKGRHFMAYVGKSDFQTPTADFAWKQEDISGLNISDQPDYEAILGWKSPRPRTALLWSDYPKDYPTYAGRTGLLKTTLGVTDDRLQVLAEIPFRSGAEFRGRGIYFRLDRETEDSSVQDSKMTKQVWMLFEYHHINQWSHRTVVYVINRSRREIGCICDTANYEEDQDDGWSKITGIVGELFLNPQQQIPGYHLSTDDIDDKWLQGATVLLVDQESLGSVQKTLEISNFTMPVSAAARAK